MITIREIQEIISQYYGVTTLDLLSESRSRSLVSARHMGMLLSRKIGRYSLPEIAVVFGRKGHNPVLHACRKMEGLIKKEGYVRKDYKYLLDKIKKYDKKG